MIRAQRRKLTSKRKSIWTIAQERQRKENCLIISHAPRDLSFRICPVNRSATLIYGRPAWWPKLFPEHRCQRLNSLSRTGRLRDSLLQLAHIYNNVWLWEGLRRSLAEDILFLLARVMKMSWDRPQIDCICCREKEREKEKCFCVIVLSTNH